MSDEISPTEIRRIIEENERLKNETSAAVAALREERRQQRERESAYKDEIEKLRRKREEEKQQISKLLKQLKDMENLPDKVEKLWKEKGEKYLCTVTANIEEMFEETTEIIFTSINDIENTIRESPEEIVKCVGESREEMLNKLYQIRDQAKKTLDDVAIKTKWEKKVIVIKGVSFTGIMGLAAAGGAFLFGVWGAAAGALVGAILSGCIYLALKFYPHISQYVKPFLKEFWNAIKTGLAPTGVSLNLNVIEEMNASEEIKAMLQSVLKVAENYFRTQKMKIC